MYETNKVEAGYQALGKFLTDSGLQETDCQVILKKYRDKKSITYKDIPDTLNESLRQYIMDTYFIYQLYYCHYNFDELKKQLKAINDYYVAREYKREDHGGLEIEKVANDVLFAILSCKDETLNLSLTLELVGIMQPLVEKADLTPETPNTGEIPGVLIAAFLTRLAQHAKDNKDLIPKLFKNQDFLNLITLGNLRGLAQACEENKEFMDALFIALAKKCSDQMFKNALFKNQDFLNLITRDNLEKLAKACEGNEVFEKALFKNSEFKALLTDTKLPKSDDLKDLRTKLYLEILFSTDDSPDILEKKNQFQIIAMESFEQVMEKQKAIDAQFLKIQLNRNLMPIHKKNMGQEIAFFNAKYNRSVEREPQDYFLGITQENVSNKIEEFKKSRSQNHDDRPVLRPQKSASNGFSSIFARFSASIARKSGDVSATKSRISFGSIFTNFFNRLSTTSQRSNSQPLE
jgi:hypothetical protein